MSNIANDPSRASAGESPVVAAPPFEQQLSADFNRAMSEASLFFEGGGKVQLTFNKITKRLEELNVAYAICGGMALSAHGYWRFTDDIDILVNRQGLDTIHERLDGLGFVRPFAQSKNLRDVQTGVRIEFLISGQFPGDGKPKEIAFPEPADAFLWVNGRRVLTLAKLVELKLASGLSGAGRDKDFGDVQELIKASGLALDFAVELHPYVQQKYRALWQSVYSSTSRYVLAWPCGDSLTKPISLAGLILVESTDVEKLKSMQALGVEIDVAKSTADYCYLVTSDPAVAERYGMAPEEEFYYRIDTSPPDKGLDRDNG